MTDIYTTKDKSVILAVQETNNGFVSGYDMRTENFMSIHESELTKETVVSVFCHVGLNNESLIGRIASFLNRRGIIFEELSKCTGMSIRTLHRYIKLNEKSDEKL